MSSNEELMARSTRISPGGVHSPVRAFKGVGGTPVFFAKAEGAYLTSVEGARYIDFCMSFGPLILGHRDPEVQAKVEEAIHTAWSFGACEPYSLELAEWITKRLPWVEKLRFVSSGTEAVMSALRVARAATGREQILKFNGMYHGHVDSMLVKAGSGLAGQASSDRAGQASSDRAGQASSDRAGQASSDRAGQATGDSAGVTKATARDTLVCSMNNLPELEQIFRAHGDSIAAVILEPLPANYGLLVQEPEYIHALVKLARSYGALVIFDEVISGFRAAPGGMAEQLGIRPDLVTFGKVIGGGFPVGCYAGSAPLMDLVAPNGPVYQAGTLSANPVGMIAGLATLTEMERRNGYSELKQRTQMFVDEFQARVQKRGFAVQMTNYESLIWLHAHSDEPIRTIEQIPGHHAEQFRKIFHALLKRGVYFAPSGYEVGFLSLAHTSSILDKTLDVLMSSLEEVYGAAAR